MNDILRIIYTGKAKIKNELACFNQTQIDDPTKKLELDATLNEVVSLTCAVVLAVLAAVSSNSIA